MSLKTKMLGLCALFSTVILIVGGIGYFSLVKVSKGYNWITSVTLGNIESNDQMYLRFRNVRTELKNLGIPGLSKEAGEKSVKLIDEAVQDYEKLQKEYFSTPFASKEEEDLANKQKEVWGHYKETADKIVALYRSGTADDQQKINTSLLKEEMEMAAPYNDIAVAIVKLQNADAKARSDRADADGNFADILSICTAILGILVGLIFGFVFSSRLAKELGSTANQLGTGSKEVALASDQLSASSQKLASGASESAASLEEGVASIEELSSMVKMNAANAQQAATLSQQGSSEASMSLEEMSRLMTCMNSIHASSKKIEEIIGVIDDIAFQTNLLALNAAVEAARAGDQGKGFAVVADAVRALAQKSASSAKDISDLIKDSVQEVGKGVQIAQSNEAVLQKLSTSIKKISDLNQEISTASREQSEGVNQLSVALNQLDKTVQGNAASAEEVAASAEELSAQSVLMKGNVDSLTSVVEGVPRKSEEKHKAPPTHAKHHNVVSIRSAPKKVAANHAIPFDEDIETAEPRNKIGTTDGF